MINLYQALKSFPPFSRQLTCKDLLFTNYDCPQTASKEQFYIECNFISYVISGKRVFHKNGVSWNLEEGVCAFVKKGAHISEREKEDGWCVMVFFMPDNFLRQLVNENRTSLPMANLPEADLDHVTPLDVNEICRSFFISMIAYFTQSPPAPENLLELKFKELVLSLLTNKKNIHFLSYLNNLSHDDSPSMEDVMQTNFAYNLSLAEYARLTCKSIPTFQRDFKKIFNETPAKWVMKKRLNKAAELLKNTSMSISDIGFECGFENQTHFSRVFKEKKGGSPMQFRKDTQTFPHLLNDSNAYSI
ncbi:MAG: helix-turn-helix transcriptional regulator [Saprospiraceae bacterium]|nr:helix-turn-helix transcriptional regulator [Saprospiraceae bacterium]